MGRWCLVGVGLLLVACGGQDAPLRAAEVRASAVAACEVGGTGAARVVRSRDSVLGPLVLIGGRTNARRSLDAFGRRGYKIPATLPAGVTATLSVPRALRGRVGLVFSHGAQDRVLARGVRGADRAVRFEACATVGRTGWPGGIVTDRRRCATLVVAAAGRSPVRRRVPLGRPC